MTVESQKKVVDSGDVWTVARIIDWTTRFLRDHGSDTPRLDAEILLAHTRGCKRIQLYTNFDAVLTDAERAGMRDLVKRRGQAEPVAYLVGHREFYGLDFRVTPAVLIPRPDTETLVLELLETAKAASQPRILDLCTGSGCIAIAAAVHLPQAELTATDISPEALAIARENAEKHQVAARIQFLKGDLLAPVDSAKKFDFIVSNPPYVAEEEIVGLDRDVRCHEPRLALDGGPAGMVLVSRVIRDAIPYLNAGGTLMVEIGYEQADLARGVFQSCSEYGDVRVLKDAAGRNRVVVAKKGFGS